MKFNLFFTNSLAHLVDLVLLFIQIFFLPLFRSQSCHRNIVIRLVEVR